MQTLEQIVDNVIDRMKDSAYIDESDKYDRIKFYKDELAKLREDTILQIKQLVKENNHV